MANMNTRFKNIELSNKSEMMFQTYKKEELESFFKQA